jgi:hypothetical protein
MELYTETTSLPNALWPEPMETVWGMLASGPGVPGSKIPHLSIADQLFVAAVVNTPRPTRPWGAITWLSDAFQISRPTIYDLGERALRGLERAVGGRPARTPLQSAAAAVETSPDENEITVTPNRIARTALTMAFPGKMALRPIQASLEVAFEQTRGVGTLNDLLIQAGRRAGAVLRQIDYRPLGPVIVLRDETYFQDWPILLVIEPVSTTILLGMVSEDAQAETWGAALLVSQDSGAHIKGLVEDMARMYPKSQKLAEVEASVQKDTWHIERWGGRVRHDLERIALAAMRKVYQLEEQLLRGWDDPRFCDDYMPAVEKVERLMAQHDQFAYWLEHLYDALELVDWRSGEIRDRETNGWLLEETLRAMEQIAQPRVQKFVRSLRRYQNQLLTFADCAAEMLRPYQQTLAAHIPDPAQQQTFIRTVACAWRLRQALINGHRSWKQWAAEAESRLEHLLDGDETCVILTTSLMRILDAAGHTSSLIECINGLLKSFLHNRRAFRNRDTAQVYLNLFVLWHNMRVYQRGKRAGQSPYQWAGIDPGTSDWLELLGYPATH